MARLISRKQVMEEKIGRSRAWIWRKVAQGDFPEPVVRRGKALWDESDVDAWISDFVAKAKKAADEEKSVLAARAKKARRGRISKSKGASAHGN